MRHKLLNFVVLFFFGLSNAQTISIVGTGVNGWPGEQVGPEITLSTNDNISYFINNLNVGNGFVKFRKDLSWTVNWGGSTFPNGNGVQDGPDIPTTTGTYDVTLNISNGTYTFIPSAAFPSIGIWGPAVNSQLGYAAPDIDMTTTDGIIYTLSGFYFSSGQAYFRQDNATNYVWGSTSFPTGTAVLSGPSMFIPSGEFFVTFNRLTGKYSFSFPGVGILGTALNGFDAPDTDLSTSNGFSYSIENLAMSIGEVKFRKDNSWNVNWGATAFPSGTGFQDGPNIPITTAGNYTILFDRVTGQYQFDLILSTGSFEEIQMKIYPNPTKNAWYLHADANKILSVVLMDSTGKVLSRTICNAKDCIVSADDLATGLYWAKIITPSKEFTIKVAKI